MSVNDKQTKHEERTGDDKHAGSEAGIGRRGYMQGNAALLASAAAFPALSMSSAADSDNDDSNNGGEFNILLKDGHLIDPKNGINGECDVAVSNGEIAKVAPDIDPGEAENTVDVSSLYVTPGLVDLHVHTYFGFTEEYGWGGGYDSVFPDTHTLPYGVTTGIDAGSSGADNFDEFHETMVEPADTRILAYLNIVREGMRSEPEQDTSLMQPEVAADVAEEWEDEIVGIKAAHYSGPEFTASERAVEAGELTDLHIMVDYSTSVVETQREEGVEAPLDDLLNNIMRVDDVLTHCYSKANVEDGEVNPAVPEAYDRGVIFDVGHGAGSFFWDHAVPMFKEDLEPHTISTDLHRPSYMEGMKNMTNVMSKFLLLGMSLEEIVKRSTWDPAKIIGHTELGHLSEGAVADIAVLDVQEGDFGLVDAGGNRLDTNQKIVNELTIKDGEVMWDLNGISLPEADVSL